MNCTAKAKTGAARNSLTREQRAKIHAEVAAAVREKRNKTSREWKAANREWVLNYNRQWKARNRVLRNADERFNREHGPTAEQRKQAAREYNHAYKIRLREAGAFKKGGKYYRVYDPVRDAPRRRRYYLALKQRKAQEIRP